MPVRLRASALALMVAIAFVPATSVSQQPQAPSSTVGPEVGERVRFRLVRAPRQRHVGIVEQVAGEEIRVRVEGWTRTYSIRMAEFAELQVQRGHGSRARGAGVGALTGALMGGVILALPRPDPNAWFGPRTRGEGALLGGILGGVLGALFGAMSPGPLWLDVPLTPPEPLTTP